MGYEIDKDGKRRWTPNGSDEAGHYWQWEPNGGHDGYGDYVCSYCGRIGRSFAGPCSRARVKGYDR